MICSRRRMQSRPVFTDPDSCSFFRVHVSLVRSSLASLPFRPFRSLRALFLPLGLFRVFLRTPWFFSHSASSRISSIRLIVRRGGRKRRSEICLRREEQGGTGGGEGRGRRETREETDGQTDESRRRRNIKLNKRSIFCSLFLTGVELRHFATLFSLRSSSPPFIPPGAPVGRPPLSSSLLLPSSAASTLFLPFGRFPLSRSPFRRLLLCFLASPSFSLSRAACASKRAAQRRGTLSK